MDSERYRKGASFAPFVVCPAKLANPARDEAVTPHPTQFSRVMPFQESLPVTPPFDPSKVVLCQSSLSHLESAGI